MSDLSESRSMKRVGIIQPNYIPWRGYFDFIQQVDTFIFLDDVQYTKGDWRNRNKVRLKSGGLTWLTVPVRNQSDTLIKDVEIDYSGHWVRKHLSTLELTYKRAPFFDMYFNQFRETLASRVKLLSDLDVSLCRLICDWLGIKTELLRASDLKCSGVKDEKLIGLTKAVGGTCYLSGPAAKAYIQPDLWGEAGLKMSYIKYPEYPEYPQISTPFEPAVSILDLLFMTGPDAPRYIWDGSTQARKEIP